LQQIAADCRRLIFRGDFAAGIDQAEVDRSSWAKRERIYWQELFQEYSDEDAA